MVDLTVTESTEILVNFGSVQLQSQNVAFNQGARPLKVGCYDVSHLLNVKLKLDKAGEHDISTNKPL